MIKTCILLALFCGAALPSNSATQQPSRQTPEFQSFSDHVLWAIKHQMPKGGGYSATPDTVNALVGNAVKWDKKNKKLLINPDKAQPSFCSGACYLVLLKALQRWQTTTGKQLSAKAWKSFDIYLDQKDGHGVWGRANANGPGFAKLIADTGTGINFTNYKDARPGDFLKIFWTDAIGRKERGHLVVYLGSEKKNGSTLLHYWSANKPTGYSTKSCDIKQAKHLIFTRITHPERFDKVTKLPDIDSLLEDMQMRDFSFSEVMDMCNIKN